MGRFVTPEFQQNLEKTVLIGASVKIGEKLIEGAEVSGVVKRPDRVIDTLEAFTDKGGGKYTTSYLVKESFPDGPYKIKVTAKTVSLEGTGSTTFNVLEVASIRIIPPEITLPEGFAFQFTVEGETAEGEIMEIKPTKLNAIPLAGPPLKIDPETGILEVKGFPGEYKIQAKYGDLKAEAWVSTVSPDTEPCCPVAGCEEIMAALLAARSYPKGNLDEVIRLYRERIPVGPFWKRVFYLWAACGTIDSEFWPGVTDEVRQLLKAIAASGELLTSIYYKDKEEEFFKRLKKLRSYNSSSPGKYNNVVICGGGGLKGLWGGNDWGCSGYQNQVLRFLNSIKFRHSL